MAKKLTSFRIDTDLLAAAAGKAEAQGETVSAVITRALRQYVATAYAAPGSTLPEPQRKDEAACPHPRARVHAGLCYACGRHV